jgi:plastocyanin
MKKLLVLLCSILALGLVATGCGGDDDEDSGGGGGGEAKQTQPSGGAQAGTVEVRMKNTEFVPQSASVKKGGKVRWTNDDSVGHDVTKEAGPGPQFKSGAAGGMNKGDTYEQTFTTPGEVTYVCTVHPGMKGNVTVK